MAAAEAVAAAAGAGAAIVTIPIAALVPRDDQPRQYFDAEGLQELADSMRASGFLAGNAITVRPAAGTVGKYEILAGHRRTRAARMAGLSEVPAIVCDMGDQQAREFVLLDNLNRADFLPWEEGAGYQELVDAGMSVEAVASKAGKSVGYVRQRMSLRAAADETRKLYLQKDIGLSVLVLLAELPNESLSPCRCRQCGVVNADSVMVCAACGADLANEIRVAGNPQAAAARLCAGKDAKAAAEVIEKVRGSYGLSAEPVQASLALSFDDARLTPEAVATRSKLERRLAEITQALHGVLKGEGLKGLDATSRAAIGAQCGAAVKALQAIQREVG